MGNKMKVGIIGAGGMAEYHVEGFRKAGAEVALIIDADLDRASAFSRRHAITHACTTLDEGLKLCADVAAVSIATPNRFHMPLAVEALNHSLHVYCEKPPALNAGEMAKMAVAARSSEKRLMFDFNNRARTESQAIMKYIRGGEAGRINSAQAVWVRRAGIPGFGGWFTRKDMSGGGPVIDLIHMLDLALYLMEYPQPAYIMASTFDDFMGNPAFKGPWGFADVKDGRMDVESACHAFITFSSGQCLSVRTAWAEMVEREVASVTFQGQKAGAKIERVFDQDGIDATSHDSCMLFTEENGLQVNRSIVVPREESMGRVANAINFIRAIEGKAEALNTPDQALLLMKIVDCMYESARTGKPVAFES
ncbi:Gfo/Idh/MocA family protein [Parasphaerochaeta coccoides]|uniref:Oxidoreductase domain protein n=1 Tax=Parasphaerochaeta coccoides (strain ATCC BAA-1237 / DSM 17374 / SPN1) TaxID=760011 RepID=F4GLW8_PARC1|nr:Gfo/Idh/MocA family oxidoreductase [Parasphaerochaeta coccoides]AEC03009.1 oxidoreductase domain protein [Parasphaerochaeta coccoides DSM 17374]